jgi:hypothetical protein
MPIQLGVIGGALLFAMWLSHFLLIAVGGLAGWIGMAVVAQNFIGSLFNNHLTDFTQSWIYMFGVGVAGAMALKAGAQKDHDEFGSDRSETMETVNSGNLDRDPMRKPDEATT